MLTKAKRGDIRRQYRMLRLAANKTQFDVESEGRLLAGRYWKIEHGIVEPDADERKRIARVLKVTPDILPTVAARQEVA